MVEHPERVDAGRLGVLTLLPIGPPEVDAFLFERVMQYVEVGVEEALVCGVEPDGLDVGVNECMNVRGPSSDPCPWLSPSQDKASRKRAHRQLGEY